MARTSQHLFILLSTLLSLVLAWDISNSGDRCGCQAYSEDPLEGCDRSKTVYVDKTPGKGHFTTVQSGELQREILYAYYKLMMCKLSSRFPITQVSEKI